MFNDIELDYNGEKFTVKANEVMRLISKVEDIITLGKLIESAQTGSPPMAKISMAYGCMLRYAGSTVKDQEVYQDMFSGQNAAQNASDACMSLLALMIPPNVGNDEKKKAAGKQSTTKGMSKTAIK